MRIGISHDQDLGSFEHLPPHLSSPIKEFNVALGKLGTRVGGKIQTHEHDVNTSCLKSEGTSTSLQIWGKGVYGVKRARRTKNYG